MNATKTRSVTDHADWDSSLGIYRCKSLVSDSIDGTEWYYPGTGEPADSEKFLEAIIMLHGGPSDGEIVV